MFLYKRCNTNELWSSNQVMNMNKFMPLFKYNWLSCCHLKIEVHALCWMPNLKKHWKTQKISFGWSHNLFKVVLLHREDGVRRGHLYGQEAVSLNFLVLWAFKPAPLSFLKSSRILSLGHFNNSCVSIRLRQQWPLFCTSKTATTSIESARVGGIMWVAWRS